MDTLIVGAGVFGLSTALHLVKYGKDPRSITVVDMYQPGTSPWSAATDYNKIIRCEYADEFYTALSLEALKQWQTDPLFGQDFSQCGRINVVPRHAARKLFEERGISNLHKSGFGHGIRLVDMDTEFPMFKVDSGREYRYNPESGLGYAARSLETVYTYLRDQGVTFYFDMHCVGVTDEGARFDDGCILAAHRILVSCGANTTRVLSMQNQVTAIGLWVGWVEVTEQEFQELVTMPIFFNAELGYVFPPDMETRRLKVCTNGMSVYNRDANVPEFVTTLSKRARDRLWLVLRSCLPQLVDGRRLHGKTCWISDTRDSDFVIDRVPGHDRVYVATGDSGHGYKFFPTIGQYIVDVMEFGTTFDRWKWCPVDELERVQVDWRVSHFREWLERV